MPAPTLLPLDLTGSAPGNLVIDEVHTFTVSTDRRFVLSAGPFFTDSLVLRDNASGRILVPGLDYKVLQPQKDAQMASGLDVSGAVWVVTTSVGAIRARYQAIGGIYSNLYDTIIEILNGIPTNTAFGQIAWNQVFGQPVQYPPTSHMHDVLSLFNMKDVVNVLEKMRIAILAGDQGAFGAVYQYVNNLLANNSYVTQTTFNTEVTNRQAGDVRLDDLLKNVSKLNGYGTASVVAALIGQLAGMSEGMVGTVTIDGHDLHIKPHGVMVQTVSYGDADGLNTTIPAVGMNLNEFVLPMTTTAPTTDGYWLVYGRVTARSDEPDTIYAPDTLAGVSDYHAISEIEFTSAGPFNPADAGGIASNINAHTVDQWMVLTVGYVTVGNSTAAVYPQAAFSMQSNLREMPATVEAIKWRAQGEASSVAALGTALAHPDGDTLLYNPTLAPATGAWLVGNVTLTGNILQVDTNAVLLWNDAPVAPDLVYTPRKAVARSQLTIPLVDPAPGNYNHYLVYGRPVFGDDPYYVPNVEYYVMPAFESANPDPMLTAFWGTGHPFATEQDYLDFLVAGHWTHLFTAIRGGLTGDNYAISPRALVNRAETGSKLSVKYYETIDDLKDESHPSKLAYVNDTRRFFKWDPTSTAVSDDVSVTYCMQSFNGGGLTAGRYLLAVAEYGPVLQQNGVGNWLGLSNFLPTGTDLLDVTTVGKYYLEGSYVNAPSGFTRGILEVEVRDGLNRQLTLRSGNFDCRIWVQNRHNNEGIGGVDWSGWYEITNASTGSTLILRNNTVLDTRATVTSNYDIPDGTRGMTILMFSPGGPGGPGGYPTGGHGASGGTGCGIHVRITGELGGLRLHYELPAPDAPEAAPGNGVGNSGSATTSPIAKLLLSRPSSGETIFLLALNAGFAGGRGYSVVGGSGYSAGGGHGNPGIQNNTFFEVNEDLNVDFHYDIIPGVIGVDGNGNGVGSPPPNVYMYPLSDTLSGFAARGLTVPGDVGMGGGGGSTYATDRRGQPAGAGWLVVLTEEVIRDPLTEALPSYDEVIGTTSVVTATLTAKGRRARIYAIAPGGGGGGGGGGGAGSGGSGAGGGGGGVGGSTGRRVVIELDHLYLNESFTVTINPPGNGGAYGPGGSGASTGYNGATGYDGGTIVITGDGWSITIPGGKGGLGGYGGADSSITSAQSAPASAEFPTINGVAVDVDFYEFNILDRDIKLYPGKAWTSSPPPSFTSEVGQAGGIGASAYYLGTDPLNGGTPGVAGSGAFPGAVGDDAANDADFGTGGGGGAGGSHGTGGTNGGFGGRGGFGKVRADWFPA